LSQKVDPQVVVLDAHMDMHAADDEAPHHVLEIVGKRVVALLVRVMLALPVGEGVSGRRDRRKPELVGDAGDGRAQMDEFVSHLGDRAADPRSHLDLRAQELRADLSAQGFFGFGEKRFGRLLDEIPGLLVDQEVLFLHADAECRFRNRHGRHCRTIHEASGEPWAGQTAMVPWA